MYTVSTVLYQVRDKVCEERDRLHEAIAETEQAIEVLTKAKERAEALLLDLETFADDAEDAAVTIAASDLEPDSYALIPERTGLAYADPTTNRRDAFLTGSPTAA